MTNSRSACDMLDVDGTRMRLLCVPLLLACFVAIHSSAQESAVAVVPLAPSASEIQKTIPAIAISKNKSCK